MRGQLYHGHYLIISPLHGHGGVANENPLILLRTLSIVGALVLLKRRAGKKMQALLLGLPKSVYYFMYIGNQDNEDFHHTTSLPPVNWFFFQFKLCLFHFCLYLRRPHVEQRFSVRHNKSFFIFPCISIVLFYLSIFQIVYDNDRGMGYGLCFIS